MKLGWALIAPKPGFSRTATLTAVLLAVTVLCVGLFYVWTRMQIVQIGYEISELESKNKELKNRKAGAAA